MKLLGGKWLGRKWLRLLAFRPDDTVMPRAAPAPASISGRVQHKYDFSGNHHYRGEMTADQRASIGRLHSRHAENFPGYVPPIPDSALSMAELAELQALRDEAVDFRFNGDRVSDDLGTVDDDGETDAHTAPEHDTMPSPVEPPPFDGPSLVDIVRPIQAACDRCELDEALVKAASEAVRFLPPLGDE